MSFFNETAKFGVSMIVRPVTIGEEIASETNEQAAAERLGYSVVLMAGFSLIAVFFAFAPVIFDLNSVVPSRLALAVAAVLSCVSLWTVVRSANRWSELSSNKGANDD